MAIKTPEGHWVNGKGEPQHPAMIKINEQLRDDLVERLTESAQELQGQMKAFKEKANTEIESYFALLLKEYNFDEKARTKKGNLTLENFSSTVKIMIGVQDKIDFDETLQIAKLKLDEFFKEETKDASPIIQTLIIKAFEVDKKGYIDSKKIFALKSYDIKAPKWIDAMVIIDESKKVAFSKSFIRFYTRKTPDAEWELVNLDFAGVA